MRMEFYWKIAAVTEIVLEMFLMGYFLYRFTKPFLKQKNMHGELESSIRLPCLLYISCRHRSVISQHTALAFGLRLLLCA